MAKPPADLMSRSRGPVVSFDLDGCVLVGPFVTSVRPRIWEHLSASSGLAHLSAEERERHIWQVVRGEHDRRLSQDDHVGAWNWQSIYNAVSHGIGGEPVPDLATIVRESCEVDAAVVLLPGAASGLQRLAQAGVRIVAITNGYYAYQWPVLEKLKIAEFFESVITP